jgi:hypothetical protein
MYPFEELQRANHDANDPDITTDLDFHWLIILQKEIVVTGRNQSGK